MIVGCDRLSGTVSVAVTLTISDWFIVGVDSAVTISFGPGKTNIYEDAEKTATFGLAGIGDRSIGNIDRLVFYARNPHDFGPTCPRSRAINEHNIAGGTVTLPVPGPATQAPNSLASDASLTPPGSGCPKSMSTRRS